MNWKERRSECHQRTAANPDMLTNSLRVIITCQNINKCDEVVPAMRIFKALVKLQEHDVLRELSLNDISQYARLVGHLKNDILLPQPLDQSDPSMPPEVLSSSVGVVPATRINETWPVPRPMVLPCHISLKWDFSMISILATTVLQFIHSFMAPIHLIVASIHSFVAPIHSSWPQFIHSWHQFIQLRPQFIQS